MPHKASAANTLKHLHTHTHPNKLQQQWRSHSSGIDALKSALAAG